MKALVILSLTLLARLTNLIESGCVDSFYHWTEWEKTRMEVLAFDHYECQACKAKGKYCKAVVVHHVKHLKERPDLALSIWDGEQRQLVSLCRRCHEEVHPERIKKWKYQAAKKQITVECWE